MYRVLLVDDEPLILSGIRFMIDWAKNDCELVATARNGRQAMEAIGQYRPNIVVADINMPVMNGMELLALASEKHPDIVFLMLTNLQEFDLVREALRMHAADYIVKTQMTPEMLEESLTIAKTEADRRSSLSRIHLAEDARRIDRQELLKSAAKRMLQGALTDEAVTILRDSGVLDGYGAARLWFPQEKPSAEKEPRRLLRWALELVEELAGKCFARHLVLESEWRYLLVLYWGEEEKAAARKSALFAEKLSAVSANVIGVVPFVLHTDYLSGEESCPACRDQLAALAEAYYLTGAEALRYSDLPRTEHRQLGLGGVPSRLRAELNNHSATGCAALIDRVAEQIREIPHERAQAIWICSELYFTAGKALDQLESNYFSDQTTGYGEIEELGTRADVLFWLQRFCNEITGLLEPLSSGRMDLLTQVRQYVEDNIDKRITLQDAANHVCISPTYLSALFKKEYGQGFVDFVNGAKMEKACRLIEEGGCRINEIGYMLGFENAYYFSKVFRRHMGLAPTEWLKKRSAE